jgi:hypothetical protein
MFSGLKSVEPGDTEYAEFRETMDGLGITRDDLHAWSVYDFTKKRPPTIFQLKGMLGCCRDWDYTTNNFDMRFKPTELDDMETAINDYIFLGEQ